MTTIQEKLFRELYPKIEHDSIFESPITRSILDAFEVFDAIRNLSDPPLTEDETDLFLDKLEREG